MTSTIQLLHDAWARDRAKKESVLKYQGISTKPDDVFYKLQEYWPPLMTFAFQKRYTEAGAVYYIGFFKPTKGNGAYRVLIVTCSEGETNVRGPMLERQIPEKFDIDVNNSNDEEDE